MRTYQQRSDMRRGEPRDRGEAGFTIVELLVSLLVGTLILFGIYQVMIGQSRAYRAQSEVTDVHRTLRQGGHLIAWELRQASASGGDIYDAGGSSMRVRSTLSSSVICRKELSSHRYALYHMAGETPAAGDSVVVFIPNSYGPADDEWRAYEIDAAGTPAAWSLSACAYPSTPTPDHVIELDLAGADTSGITVGSLVRVFRPIEYGTFSTGGRTWFGRRSPGTAWQPLAGPVDASDGLEMTWYDAAGSATTTESAIVEGQFIIRGEAQNRSEDGFHQDSVVMRVKVRG